MIFKQIFSIYLQKETNEIPAQVANLINCVPLDIRWPPLPNMKSFTGLEKFEGKVVHSHDFRYSQDFK